MAAFFSDSSSSTTTGDLRLLPYPRRLMISGAPWRPMPAMFFNLSPAASAETRRRAQILCEEFGKLGYSTRLGTATNLTANQALFTANPPSSKQGATIDKSYLQGASNAPEGYRMMVDNNGVALQGSDSAGFWYAGQTLVQLLKESNEIPSLQIEDYPLLPNRALHLDIRGWPPTKEYFQEILENLSQFKVNRLIVEYGNSFAYESQAEIVSKNALTAKDIGQLVDYARDRNITIIPLLSTLGEAGDFLQLEINKEYREIPEYSQQLCPGNIEGFNLAAAMLEELVAVHPGTFVHLGGNEIRFLGWCAKCREHAKNLGGTSELFLEYVHKVFKYANKLGRKPLFWDDVFSKLNEGQLQRLPGDFQLLVRFYAGGNGRANPQLLVQLDKYRQNEQIVWGASQQQPSTRFESFDNIDGWAETADLGYLSGLVTTIKTRAYPQGPMHQPIDVNWPGILYAAERMWSGRKPTSRHEFADRFAARFHGAKKRLHRERVWGIYDMFLRNRPRESREYLKTALKENSDLDRTKTLGVIDALTGVLGFQEYLSRFEKSIAENYAQIKNGSADPFHTGRLRWRLLNLKQHAEPITETFKKKTQFYSPDECAKEYLDSELSYDLERLGNLEKLLSPYPLPPKDWQRQVRL